MWQQLTPAEKARLFGQAALGIGMTALSVALIYTTYRAYEMWQLMPELLAQVENTSEKIQPTLKEAEAIRSLVPPILDEVKEVRKLVPPVLAEVKSVRELVPALLAEVESLRVTLPPLVETSAASISDASTAVLSIEPHIPPILAEVKQTREAIPGIISQADKVVGRASNAGKEAGQGAVQGVITGIVLAPFSLVGNVGKGMFDILGFSGQTGLTVKDESMVSVATQDLLNVQEPEARKDWYNSESENGGSVTVVKQRERDGMSCLVLHHHVVFATKKTHDADIEMCKQPDGKWIGLPLENNHQSGGLP